ncbi:aminopeptidase [bacterium]|nr:aminopeptidase [bacterium]
MSDSRLSALAHLLVDYSVEARRNQKITISGSVAGLPLVREVYREVLEAGAHPNLRLGFEGQEDLFHRTAQDHQREYADPFQLYETKNADALIMIMPGYNPHELTAVSPEAKQQVIRARNPIMETIFSRWSSGEFNWVGTLFPTAALAQEARMSLQDYTEFVFACMHMNDDDPAAFWRAFSREQQQRCDRLDQAASIRITGEDTDITFSCRGRTWINCDGKNNFPDGEIFTGPVEESVEGAIRFTYPGIYQGEEIENIFLRFEHGRVVEATAAKGQRLLEKVLETDEGSRRLGEAAIGTNYGIDRFSKMMLFDEKMGGTVHLALGRGIPRSGSRNVSAVHWDMLKDMKNGGCIYADGELIYRDGRFLD